MAVRQNFLAMTRYEGDTSVCDIEGRRNSNIEYLMSKQYRIAKFSKQRPHRGLFFSVFDIEELFRISILDIGVCSTVPPYIRRRK